MKTKTMIALVGEQPIPVLLPLLSENKSFSIEQVILVCSSRTKHVGERLKRVLDGTFEMVELICVEPYDIIKAEKELLEFISKKELSQNQIVFNLTGGTKSMAFAAYSLAEEMQSTFLYIQSEGKKTQVHSYYFNVDKKLIYKSEEAPPVLNIDTYLKAHLDGYKEKQPRPENRFEIVVSDVLRSILDEIKTSVTIENIDSGEIDLVLRCGNNIGISEVKSGNKALSKEGIDQLNTAADPRFLGTYATKILIVDRTYPENNSALAKAHRIKVIELVSFSENGGIELSETDKEKLASEVINVLGG